MRSLNVFYNFQMQYTPPPIPLYWWSLYNTSTFVARKQRSIERLRQSDNSRSQFYDFMDAMFHRTDNSSGDCLLKVICELARAPLSEDVIQRQQDDLPTADDGDDYGRSIFHGLINTIFTPYFPNVSERYVDAAKAGANGAGCDELYGECSSIDEWLKRLTIVM
ncbi:uncharacterized protein LOC109613498 [Musca domestica]|uniref:Uncharacterized protein LOC109613498 n=1 Tax=Musca domestica TaxID=7370 RepID=A0ABM3VR28_MUSDO|nr:uncharacterized protein LOC109613498 [Musca domestica]